MGGRVLHMENLSKGVALGKVEYLQNKRVMGLKPKVFKGEWGRKSLLNIGGEENKVCQSPGLVAWTSSSGIELLSLKFFVCLFSSK